ncbi:MAG: ABC transporter permease [Candidatus Faecalibacterium intestinavium]|uniref:ABC transporter permease n=1 Tax=Candidatus Faecalibacterium intestinavium TaxID=2838580 RepID=A0A9E2KKQ7_9FIRM|nr:ABC transporter permease [Candidatus Faecalibacterium intestinavium]
MAKYVVKRVLLAILTIFIVSAITFFSMYAIPGGPFSSEKALSPAVMAALEARYGLDQPVPVQYVNYMTRLITQRDFGVSLKTGRDVFETITTGMKVSAKLGISAAVVAVFFGLIFGSIAALNRGKVVDRIIVFITTLATSVPSFVLATLLLLVFSIQLGLVPAWSANNQSYILPVISLCMYPMAYITRLTKTSMLDALNQDYVRTARAKGVATYKVIFKHALRNALIPVVTYVGPMVAFIITGSMVVETIFSTGGLGSYFVTSINTRDYTLIMGVTIFLAILMVTANLITDIVYKLVDPRITFD